VSFDLRRFLEAAAAARPAGIRFSRGVAPSQQAGHTYSNEIFSCFGFGGMLPSSHVAMHESTETTWFVDEAAL
jgi:hypothetical protein